jgi:hypothetical protein
MKDIGIRYEDIGLYLCIFSIFLITLSFALFPLFNSNGMDDEFHLLLPGLIIGLSLLGLALTYNHERIGVRVGALCYFIPVLSMAAYAYSSFTNAIPEDPSCEWEMGMHFLIIVGLVLQYIGSLLYPRGRICLPRHKTRANVIDGDAPIGYREVIIGIMKGFANFLIVSTILLCAISLVTFVILIMMNLH